MTVRHLNMKKLVVIAGLLLISLTVNAQTLNDNPMRNRLDSAVDLAAKSYLSKSGRVGISIGISYNKRHYHYNYGQRAPGSKQLPTAESVYEIGSITKTFTGLLVAHAINEGKMKLSEIWPD